MFEKKQLNEQDLQKVSGGVATGSQLPEHGAMITGNEIKKHYGEHVYTVSNKYENHWAYCILERHCENAYVFLCISTNDDSTFKFGRDRTPVYPNAPFVASENEVTIFLAS